MDRLAAGLGDLPRHLLPLGGQVELFRVPAAQLVGAHPEPVAAGLLGDRDQVGAGGEGGEQFVDRGPRQLEPAGDLGGGEGAVAFEEEFEYVQCPGHRGDESPHDHPPHSVRHSGH